MQALGKILRDYEHIPTPLQSDNEERKASGAERRLLCDVLKYRNVMSHSYPFVSTILLCSATAPKRNLFRAVIPVTYPGFGRDTAVCSARHSFLNLGIGSFLDGALPTVYPV